MNFYKVTEGTAKTAKDDGGLQEGESEVEVLMGANENAMNIPITNIGGDENRGELWYILSKHPEVWVEEGQWQNEKEAGGMVEGYTVDGETFVSFVITRYKNEGF